MKSQKLSQQTIKSKTLERLQQVRNWLRKIPSFTTILSLVETGLTIFDLYLRTRQKQSPRTENEISEVVNKTQTQSQTQRKIFGME